MWLLKAPWKVDFASLSLSIYTLSIMTLCKDRISVCQHTVAMAPFLFLLTTSSTLIACLFLSTLPSLGLCSNSSLLNFSSDWSSAGATWYGSPEGDGSEGNPFLSMSVIPCLVLTHEKSHQLISTCWVVNIKLEFSFLRLGFDFPLLIWIRIMCVGARVLLYPCVGMHVLLLALSGKIPWGYHCY